MNKKTTTSTQKRKAKNSGISGSINKMKKRFHKMSTQEIVGVIFLVLLLVGGISAMVLIKSNEDLRNQAWIPEDPYLECSVSAPCAGSGLICVRGNCVPRPTSGPNPTMNPDNCDSSIFCCGGSECDNVKMPSNQ